MAILEKIGLAGIFMTASGGHLHMNRQRIFEALLIAAVTAAATAVVTVSVLEEKVVNIAEKVLELRQEHNQFIARSDKQIESIEARLRAVEQAVIRLDQIHSDLQEIKTTLAARRKP